MSDNKEFEVAIKYFKSKQESYHHSEKGMNELKKMEGHLTSLYKAGQRQGLREKTMAAVNYILQDDDPLELCPCGRKAELNFAFNFGSRYLVECTCGMATKLCKTELMAFDIWNTRHLPESVEGVRTILGELDDFLSGMLFDPSIPDHAKEAINFKLPRITEVLRKLDKEIKP